MPSRAIRRQPWKPLAALAIVLLAGVAIWAMPRRAVHVVPADENIAWDGNQQPARRVIVWRSPETLVELLPPQMSDAVVSAPRFSEGGTTLYCTVRVGNGQADIYRAQFSAGKWGQLAAVPALNSERDDAGAFVTFDDGRVYFHSDRPGGSGGFDLYVAERQGEDWGPPRNLGSRINTRANEYDAALSADGQTLYFASNRTESMARRAAEDATGDEEPSGSPTVRGHLGMSHLDLYAADCDSTGGDWQSAQPLTELNRDDSDEGSPFLSPDGVHLYFASNRAPRASGKRDLDIYAARRVGDRFDLPENIGSPINTPADETQPALSPEGFTLLFASDRAGADAIYASRAMQVFEEVAWDTSHLAALWRVWPLALLITVAAGVLAAIALQLRGWLAETASSVRFFAGSVIFHLLLLVILTFWTLPTVVSVIISKIQEAEAASQPFDDNQHQSHEDGQQAWEKLADLTAVDKAIDLIRRETEPINIPNDTQRLEPTIPIELARLLPTDQVLYTPPSEPAELSEPQQITARSMALPAAAIEVPDAVEELLAPAQPSAELTNVAQQVELQRTEPQPVAVPVELSEPTAVVVPRVTELSVKAPADSPQLDAPLQESTTTRRPISVVQQAAEITDETTAPVLPLAKVVELPAEVQEQIQLGRTTPSRPATEPAQPAEVRSARPATALPAAVSVGLSQAKPTEPNRDLARAKPVRNVTADLGTSEPMQANPPQPATPDSLAAASATVELNRSDVKPPRIEVPIPEEMTGPDRGLQRVLVGELSEVAVDLPPRFGPIVSQLQRPRAKATKVVYAADSVGLREMFTLRQSDIRKQFIELFDGTQESEQAVNHGLVWLVTHQNANGSWSLNNFHVNCKDKHADCAGAGSAKSDTAATGLALLPLLASGNTHQGGEYQQQVAAAVKWLTETQQENGDLLSAGDQQPLYSHSIAAIALCEVYGMTADPQLKPHAEKALDFLVKAQHAATGGWRYSPNQPADTSVVGWAVMALKSGEMAGISVPAATIDNVARWLASVEGNKPLGGAFGYQNASPTPAMTAEGLLCLQFMGADRNDPRMRAGADYLLQHLPEPEQRLTSYYWYYGTQVMYHMQGEYWEAWNNKLRDHLVQTQVNQGTLAGTWDPRDNWEKSGGRVFSTAVKLLMLEVYYRHLPLYEQLDE